LIVAWDGRDNVDSKIMAAVVAAVQAYIDQENTQPVKHKGQVLNPWKMGARSEQMGRRSPSWRANPLRTRLSRFSLR
jgi:hypothetical protein